MAEQAYGAIALCLLPQSAQGTINATISALTDTANTTNGLLVGVGDAGIRQSGIVLPTATREGLDLARIGNSRIADQFVREVFSDLSIVLPFGGARNTTSGSAVDADFNLSTHWPGLDAALRGSGLTGAADGAGVGHVYTPSGNATYVSAALWFGGFLLKFKDLLCELEFDFTPQQIPRLSVAFPTLGELVSFATQALNTVTPGNQATTVSKTNSVANSYGQTRSFLACTVGISPVLETFPDSNASANRVIQTGCDIDLATTLIADASDPDYDRDQMLLTTAPTADMAFGLAASGNALPALGWKVSLNNLTQRSRKPVEDAGAILAHEIEAEARAISTAGSEFSLTFW